MRYSAQISGVPAKKVLSLVAFNGACRVEAQADQFFGGSESRPYVGDVIESPTWRRLYHEAQAQQLATRDVHHEFFEGARIVRVVDGIRVIELLLGS